MKREGGTKYDRPEKANSELESPLLKFAGG